MHGTFMNRCNIWKPASVFTTGQHALLLDQLFTFYVHVPISPPTRQLSQMKIEQNNWLAKNCSTVYYGTISLYMVLNRVTCSVIFWEFPTTKYHNIMHTLLFPGNGWLQHGTANGRYPSRQGPGEPRATPPSTKGPHLCSPGLCWGKQGTCMQQWLPHWLWISRWLPVL